MEVHSSCDTITLTGYSFCATASWSVAQRHSRDHSGAEFHRHQIHSLSPHRQKVSFSHSTVAQFWRGWFATFVITPFGRVSLRNNSVRIIIVPTLAAFVFTRGYIFCWTLFSIPSRSFLSGYFCRVPLTYCSLVSSSSSNKAWLTAMA